MEREIDVITEAITSLGNATQDQIERIIHALDMQYIVQKTVLDDEEARKYANVSKTRWYQLKKDRLFPYREISGYKSTIRREDLDFFLSHIGTAIHSAIELKQEASKQLAKRNTKNK